MTQIKNFFLNNEHYTTQDEINLYDLITYFDYNESLLVLEYNRVIFDKSHWKTTFVQLVVAALCIAARSILWIKYCLRR